MKRLILLLLLSISGAAIAANLQAAGAPLSLSVAIPISGAKTLVRFLVSNVSDSPIVVYAPFANGTRLIVTDPNGQRKEHFNWKEMPGPPTPLSPGNTVQWDIDIAQWVDLSQKGTYVISFSVNGRESSHLTFVRD